MIRVQQEDFDPGAEIETLTAGRTDIGAVVSFVGLVRGAGPDGSGSAVNEMTLEHYPGMTERELARIENEALERWPITSSLIVHRYGTLKPGERIVLVITTSSHRAAAYEANEFLVDWLKTKAPFWKREQTPDGENWVAADKKDEEAADRWKT